MGDEAAGAIAPPKASEHQKALAVKASKCMRAHGIAQFPDPTESPPNPAALGSGGVPFGRGGMFWVVRGSDVHSPAFDSAAQKCGMLPRGVHPPSSSAPCARGLTHPRRQRTDVLIIGTAPASPSPRASGRRASATRLALRTRLPAQNLAVVPCAASGAVPGESS